VRVTVCELPHEPAALADAMRYATVIDIRV
jgi:hypothetical protein